MFRGIYRLRLQGGEVTQAPTAGTAHASHQLGIPEHRRVVGAAPSDAITVRGGHSLSDHALLLLLLLLLF